MEVAAKCRSIQIGKSKSHTASHPSYQVVAEMYVTSKGAHEGQTYVWYGSLNGGAIPITHRSLQAMGFQGQVRDITRVTKEDVQKPCRLALRQTEKGGWQCGSVFPLQRDLGVKLTEGEHDELSDILRQASGAEPTEPGANDEPDEYADGYGHERTEQLAGQWADKMNKQG